MALYGPLHIIKKQAPNYPGFSEAFEYLDKVLDAGSEEQARLLSHLIGSFVKIPLNESLFALEQVYESKEREACFFESHRQYIDIQFILKGEERIDVVPISELTIDMPYDDEKDFIKYHDVKDLSSLLLRPGYVAIFFPEDAHMPCLQKDTKTVVYKTVVKVPVVQ